MEKGGRDAARAGSEVQQLSALYLYVTNQCNMRCRHCWISPSYAGERTGIDPMVYVRGVDQALSLGLKYVKITGGEPLLYPGLEELIRCVGKARVGMRLETNGTLVTPRWAELLSEARVGTSVSLDGATAATHDGLRGVAGAWEMAVEGIKVLVAAGSPPLVIMSVHQGNLAEIEPTVELASRLGAAGVKVNCIAPLGRAKAMASQGELLGMDALLWLKQRGEKEYAERHGLRVSVDLPCAFDTLSGMSKRALSACPFLWLLSILANGDITFCGLGYAEPAWVMGNVKRDNLVELWQSHPLLREARRVLPDGLRGVCGKCLFRRRCLGKCRALAIVTSGDLSAPDPFCQALYERGSFPMTRLASLPQDGEGGG